MSIGCVTFMDYVHGKGRVRDVRYPHVKDAHFVLPDVAPNQSFNDLREGDTVAFDLILGSPRRATNVRKLQNFFAREFRAFRRSN